MNESLNAPGLLPPFAPESGRVGTPRSTPVALDAEPVSGRERVVSHRAEVTSTREFDHVRLVRDALEQLQDDARSLARWTRERPPRLEHALAHWIRGEAPPFDRVVRRDGIAEAIASATRGIAPHPRAWLRRDLASLANAFADATNSERVRIFFGAVRTDQCRKFHMDYLRYRLISTYLGPGTEWVPEAALDREALAHPPDCPCEANRRIVRDSSAVRRAAAGDVLLLRGLYHPSSRGTVHRSPPIEDAPDGRVVFIVSTIEVAG